jgi:hypothetical protein
MNSVLLQLKEEARALCSGQRPVFYTQFQSELAFSREMFFDHPLILRCREDVLPFLGDSFGHGIQHAKSVAVEASAIVLIEGGRLSMKTTRHLALLAQLSGLLHDICRLDEDHARRGEELSRMILHDYPLSDQDKTLIAFSIRNHEAFAPAESTDDPQGALLSGALYDADKFRWGPDNFSTTLWEICDYQEWSLDEIASRFPMGLEKMEEIKATFRTEVGKSFGPEFISIGMSTGKAIYRRLKELSASKAP